MRPIIAFLFASVLGFAQVRVEVRTDRAEYLTGEPVFAVVEVTNMSSAPMAFSLCLGQVDLAIQGQAKRGAPDFWGCLVGRASDGSGCVMSQPPTMASGETVAFWYLLKGYRLPAGDYALRVSGQAGVPRVLPGREFDASLQVHIHDAGEEELKARYASWVREAADGDRRDLAREAIVEMAPAFLEKTIAGFEGQLAIEGLGRIDTEQSRRDLVTVLEKSPESWARELARCVLRSRHEK